MNAHKADWNDINVAYHVARCGTLTAAAEVLGVHHSTVLRRVNALEKKLATKLFHRHARGYVPTEAGELLTQVAENTQASFDSMIGKLQGVDTQLSGTLIITTVNSMATNLIPLLEEFQSDYPAIKLEYAEESRIFKLEHGEAHISIRPGTKPKEPDYVVQHLAVLATTLYANSDYIEKFGTISDIYDQQQISKHRFISTIEPFNNVSFMRWMNKLVPSEQVFFRSNSFNCFAPAVKAGLGVAPVSCWLASREPALKAMIKPPPDWHHDLWLVTHGDMHRTSKVQAFTQFIKLRMKQEQSTILGAKIEHG